MNCSVVTTNASVIPQEVLELEELQALQHLHQPPIGCGLPWEGLLTLHKGTCAITVQLRAVGHHLSRHFQECDLWPWREIWVAYHSICCGIMMLSKAMFLSFLLPVVKKKELHELFAKVPTYLNIP